jgi:hypothetical protein
LASVPPLTGVDDADLKRITAPVSPPPVIESEFIGEIRTENEYPTAETVDRLYDQLDFQRACQVFLRHITASSMYSFREGLRRDLGATTPQHYVTWEGPFDANSLLLTPNSETVYRLPAWSSAGLPRARRDRGGQARQQASRTGLESGHVAVRSRDQHGSLEGSDQGPSGVVG